MDLEQTIATLLSEKEQLKQENGLLKSVLSVVKENVDLRARMQSYNNDTLGELTGIHTSKLGQSTFERQFRKDLQQPTPVHEQRTSSPVDFKSFIQNSVHTDYEGAEFQSCLADVPLKVKERMLGDIAFQLDRRILAHVFRGHKRLYGFTLHNIQEKITEVSTKPLTGELDEGYWLHLTQRYTDLMERLNQLGYKRALHPQFSEFIVNEYGILKDGSDKNIMQATDYNNPDFLEKLIMTTAPKKLQTNLLLLLTCLSDMAKVDRTPLFSWSA